MASMRRVQFCLASAVIATAVCSASTPVFADWSPEKDIEFVATSKPGGGTDRFTRAIHSAIKNNDLVKQDIRVVYQGAANGTQGLVYIDQSAGNPHKLAFATSQVWMLPLTSKLGYDRKDLTPLAAMAFDEFIIWVNADRPYDTVAAFLEAARKNPKGIKIGGGKSKDADHVFTKLIEARADVQFTYVPYKGGAEAAVQLAGGHVDANTNNPAENLAQWQAGKVVPLCVASPTRMADTGIVAQGKSWADIPTCIESGLDIESFRFPRTVFMPGGLEDGQLSFWQGVMRQVVETEEWKAYVTKSGLTSALKVGDEFNAFIEDSEGVGRQIFERAGWLENN